MKLAAENQVVIERMITAIDSSRHWCNK